MELQFDPFAFGVAVLALLLAWRAHYLAKKAPEAARKLEIRDQIRDQIDALRKSADPLRGIFQLGQPLIAPPASFHADVERVRDLSGRVPEKDRIESLHISALSLDIRWSSAFHDETQLDLAKQRAHDWQEKLAEARAKGTGNVEFVKTTFDGYTKDVDKGGRAADASRTQVRESHKEFQTQANEYIAWLDSLDRGKPKWWNLRSKKLST